MGDFIHKPQNVIQVDDKGGNAYTIFSVDHIASAAGDETAFEVDPSVISAKHLEAAGQTVVTITLQAEAAATPGVSGQTQRIQWSKTLSFPSESATGNYVIAMRHSGSAASIGSHRGQDL